MNRTTRLIIILIILSASIFTIYKNKDHNVNRLGTMQNLVPVVIIGSGPAGLSGALYTARADFKTIVISGDQLGGTLMDVQYIENWPGRKKTTGAQAVEELQDQAKQFGTIVLIDAVNKVDFSCWPYKIFTENNQQFNALSVIIATGGTQKRLNIEGVEQYWGHGVGLCSLCEAPFNKDKDVAIIGGGDTAAAGALQLAAYAKRIYMIARDPQLDANATVQSYLKKNKNIEIRTNSEAQKISGDEINVTSITVLNKLTNQTEEIPISGVYFSIGYVPNSQLFKNFLPVDSRGFIITNCYTQETKLSGIFVAGNVAASDRRYGKAGVALGSGIKAGIDSINYLERIGLTPQKIKELESQFYKIDSGEKTQTPSKTS